MRHPSTSVNLAGSVRDCVSNSILDVDQHAPRLWIVFWWLGGGAVRYCCDGVRVGWHCHLEAGSGARQFLIGFSADAVAVSNRRRFGQGSRGAGTPLGRWDGSKEGQL